MPVAIINVTENRASFVNEDFSALFEEASVPVDALVAAVSASLADRSTIARGLATEVIERLGATFHPISDRIKNLLYLPLGRDVNSECYMVVEAQGAVFSALEPRSISQSYLAMALQSSGIGAWSLNIRTRQADRTFSHDAIFGYNGLAPHWDLDAFLSHVVEEDRSQVREAFEKALLDKLAWQFKCKIRRLDGELRWIEASGYPRGPGNTLITHFTGLVKDITNEINAAEQRRLLFAELHHRVRNNLAVVHSLASGTLRMATDTATAAEALRRRITAMSDAHNLMLDVSDAPVSVKQALESITSRVAPLLRLQIEGTDAKLSLSHVVPLSMWIMELLSRLHIGQQSVVKLHPSNEMLSLTWTTKWHADSGWSDMLSEPLVLHILPAQMGGKARVEECSGEFSVVLTIKPVALNVRAPLQHTLTATAMLI